MERGADRENWWAWGSNLPALCLYHTHCSLGSTELHAFRFFIECVLSLYLEYGLFGVREPLLHLAK